MTDDPTLSEAARKFTPETDEIDVTRVNPSKPSTKDGAVIDVDLLASEIEANADIEFWSI